MKTPSFGLDQNGEGKFVDRYFGRVPKFLHRIPERGICEANPDYIDMIKLIIEGKIHKDNISEELYREAIEFINKMCNPCIMDEEDRALMRAIEGLPACPEPSKYMMCDDIICCSEELSCAVEFKCPDEGTDVCDQYATFVIVPSAGENKDDVVDPNIIGQERIYMNSYTGDQESKYPISRIDIIGNLITLEYNSGEKYNNSNTILLVVNDNPLTGIYMDWNVDNKAYQHIDATGTLVPTIRSFAESGTVVKICIDAAPMP